MLTKTLKVETDNHLNIMESVKKLAASSGQPLIVIDGEGTLLYINVLGKEVLKKKGRSRMMRKIFLFSALSPILPTTTTIMRWRGSPIFGRKRTLCISAEYAPDGLVGGRGLCGGLI